MKVYQENWAERLRKAQGNKAIRKITGEIIKDDTGGIDALTRMLAIRLDYQVGSGMPEPKSGINSNKVRGGQQDDPVLSLDRIRVEAENDGDPRDTLELLIEWIGRHVQIRKDK